MDSLLSIAFIENHEEHIDEAMELEGLIAFKILVATYLVVDGYITDQTSSFRNKLCIFGRLLAIHPHHNTIRDEIVRSNGIDACGSYREVSRYQSNLLYIF